MTQSLFSSIALVLLAISSQVSAHGVITGVAGANGVQGAGFGVIATTPRDGSKRNPFQQDTSIIRDRDISSGKAGECGRTLAGGSNDVQSQLAAAATAGLPTASADGQLSMTLHQVNGDGAGPYTCEVSTDGGNTFQPATVVTDVPGKNGRSKAKATDFPLVMQVASTTACAGGPNGDACIARCRNPANAGPFGGCVAFAMGGASAAESNVTANAADASVAADASAVATEAAADTATEDASTATASAVEAAATTETGAAKGEAAGAAAVVGAGAVAANAAKAKAKGAAAQAVGAKKGAAAGKKGKKAKAARRFSRFVRRQDEDMDPLDLHEYDDVVSRETEIPHRESARKRVINSRIAGRNAGYWIDA